MIRMEHLTVTIQFSLNTQQWVVRLVMQQQERVYLMKR